MTYELAKVLALGLSASARLAQSVERKALNLVVVGSSPTVGVLIILFQEADRMHAGFCSVRFQSIRMA